MSEIKKVTVNGIEFTFINKWSNSRSGFSHTSELFQNSACIGTAMVHYINRTWESYSFQTSMKRAVGAAISERESWLIDDFKRKFCKNSTTQAEKYALISKDDVVALYTELNHNL